MTDIFWTALLVMGYSVGLYMWVREKYTDALRQQENMTAQAQRNAELWKELFFAKCGNEPTNTSYDIKYKQSKPDQGNS